VKKSPKNLFQIIIVTALLLVLVLISVRYGSTNEWNDWVIFESRLPHVIGAVVAGASLALCGHFMQWIFRNPLAGPSVLGVTSGASLGVAIVFFLPTMLFTSPVIPVMGAFIGSLAVLLIMAILSKRFQQMATLLIAQLTGALETILLKWGSDSSRSSFLFWGMGSLDALHFKHLIWLLLGAWLPLIPLLFMNRALNAYALGDEISLTSGVNIHQLRILFFVAIGLAVSSVTAWCGPLVFIGFVAPHAARIIFRTGNLFWLNMGVPLLGALFLLLADLISRIYGLPINAILALLGLPFMIYILLFSKYSQSWMG
jgi:iron complex transport system permease protein